MVKTNRTSFVCENRNGHDKTELGTQRHVIGQQQNYKDEQHRPHQKQGVNSCARER